MFDFMVVPVSYRWQCICSDFCHIARSCLGAGVETVDNWVHSGLSSFIALGRRYEGLEVV